VVTSESDEAAVGVARLACRAVASL